MVAAKQAAVSGWTFANTHSTRTSTVGDASQTAGHVNLGQPACWIYARNIREGTFSFWFRKQTTVNTDGTLFGNANNTYGATHVALSSGNIVAYFGGYYASSSGLTLGNGAWHLVTWTVRNESGTYVGRIFVDGSSTSVANANAGPDTGSAIDVLLGQKHASSGTDYAYGEHPSCWFAHLTYWTSGFTGTQHTELYNAGVPIDPRTHSQAASLANYLPLGSGDSGTTMADKIGSVVGTYTFTSDIALEAVHP
jgi:hypothetical protein